jgi:hypothetical protein
LTRRSAGVNLRLTSAEGCCPHGDGKAIVVFRDQAGLIVTVDVTDHFKMRAAQRRFTSVEALNVLRHGRIRDQAEYQPFFGNWKYVLCGKHDRGTLHIVAALAFRGAMIYQPVVLITGYIR